MLLKLSFAFFAPWRTLRENKDAANYEPYTAKPLSDWAYLLEARRHRSPP